MKRSSPYPKGRRCAPQGNQKYYQQLIVEYSKFILECQIIIQGFVLFFWTSVCLWAMLLQPIFFLEIRNVRCKILKDLSTWFLQLDIIEIWSPKEFFSVSCYCAQSITSSFNFMPSSFRAFRCFFELNGQMMNQEATSHQNSNWYQNMLLLVL